MSLANALAPFDWTVDGARFRINLIDTPGHDDFAAVAASSLAVADLAVIVVSATDGVEPGTERAWTACEPRRSAADVRGQGGQAQCRLPPRARRRASPVRKRHHALELPIGELGTFRGVADLLADTDTSYDDDGGTHQIDPPPDIADEQHELHDALVEDVVTDDDDQLERYLAGDTPTVPELERTLAHEVLTGTIVPVMVGSAVTGVGIDKLADALVHLGPPPQPSRILVDGEETDVPPHPDGDPLVHVFATRADPFIGQIALLKVLSGTIANDDRVTNASTGTEERLHGLFRLRGKEHLPTASAAAGDLVAVAKLAGSPRGRCWRCPADRSRCPRRPPNRPLTRWRCGPPRPPTRTGFRAP